MDVGFVPSLGTLATVDVLFGVAGLSIGMSATVVLTVHGVIADVGSTVTSRGVMEHVVVVLVLGGRRAIAGRRAGTDGRDESVVGHRLSGRGVVGGSGRAVLTSSFVRGDLSAVMRSTLVKRRLGRVHIVHQTCVGVRRGALHVCRNIVSFVLVLVQLIRSIVIVAVPLVYTEVTVVHCRLGSLTGVVIGDPLAHIIVRLAVIAILPSVGALLMVVVLLILLMALVSGPILRGRELRGGRKERFPSLVLVR
jgi:hypothetical protein